MDQRYGRIGPDPCSGLCDADVLPASQLQHSVQHADGDGHLARLSPIRLRAALIERDLPNEKIIILETDRPFARCRRKS